MQKQVIVICLFLMACHTTIEARQVVVCQTCVVSTVAEGIALALPGDTVLIKSGHYHESNIVVDKSITLLGEDYPILDADNGNEVLTVIAKNVTISGLQIQNVGTSYVEDRAGIRMKRADGFVLTDNKLYNTFFGIYIEHSDNGTIQNNYVEGSAVDEMSSGNAIHIWYCNSIIVSDNVVLNHRDGIYFEFVDSSEIHGNHSSGNLRYGLHFMFSNNDNYVKNTFSHNGAGVAVMFSKNINMIENIFVDNWGKSSYGLLLKEIYDAEILNNTFTGNSIGIFVEGSTRINYTSNVFENNGWAIKVSGGCLDNEVSGNNFISNTFDLAIYSNAAGNKFEGNYWSMYSGYDLDRNGIGDVPYRPVKLFNFIVHRTPESIVLLRSLFIDIINFSERVSPVLTPANVLDSSPSMFRFENAGA
jgi:nitrous oxidase accessory protein